MKRTALSFVFFVCTVFLTNAVSAEVTAQRDTAGQWLISENGKPVIQYNYETVPLPEGYLDSLKSGKQYAVPRSNYVHPLFGLNGKPITNDWADDHAHHRGIYWAWPEVGYKGELGDLHALQKVFARPTGKIETIKKDGALSLCGENIWKWKDEEPIVQETAAFTVYPLSTNGRKINLDFRFKCLVDEITLARRAQQHYGGLNTRMAKLDEFKSGWFREHEGDAAKTGAAWVFATWKDTETGKTMELTVFEKADNPDYPGDYIEYPNLQWFQATFPKAKTRYTLKKDDVLTLRFQLWLHEATADDTAKKAAWKEFQER
ncbi:MAG: PmoA family protein [Planctomycetaceae bacterium]|nr:PmoA family protein [Planctomycetaceae bacterium]